ncbi:putative glycosidase [Flavihumibacter petaseus NBRC 106054]|uniref:Putative glycosidase n=2 Tax=Flavihumibacter TaxID=1004301 RepID=A0A0E9MYH7_9BACT|nr:putative glycosidase [Flavihumibacter petaseus NBRC 106054]
MQLEVNGQPFLILGGELGNSNASEMAYMQPYWAKFDTMHLNTVLAPVYWELLEPEEGRYDFALVDSLLQTANRKHLKLVLLWFGTWKNSMSCYAPGWVKKDTRRFARAVNDKGATMEILSAFSPANRDADRKAFVALMEHLRQYDSQRSVLMIQVENEIGMLEAAREKSPAADKAFEGEVPAALIKYLTSNKDVLMPEFRERWAAAGFRTVGNWETVFGKGLDTDEIFQAWHYAKYAGDIAAAGKKAYPLPMFVNAALNHRNVLPGQYPSAGPLPQVMDIWKAAAPAIDLLSPDFYNPRFRYYSDLYIRGNNTLFIPEIWMHPDNGAKAFYAFGHYHALGFSPFSIESTNSAGSESIGKSYAVLEQLVPVLAAIPNDRVEGILLDTATKKQSVHFGGNTMQVNHDYTLNWSREASLPNWPEGGVMIVQLDKDEYIFAGTGFVITFPPSVGILQADEGKFVNGQWKPGRRLNGDQTHQGRHIRIPVGKWGIQRVKLYSY